MFTDPPSYVVTYSYSVSALPHFLSLLTVSLLLFKFTSGQKRPEAEESVTCLHMCEHQQQQQKVGVGESLLTSNNI